MESVVPIGYMLPRAVCTSVTVGEVGRLVYRRDKEEH